MYIKEEIHTEKTGRSSHLDIHIEIGYIEKKNTIERILCKSTNYVESGGQRSSQGVCPDLAGGCSVVA